MIPTLEEHLRSRGCVKQCNDRYWELVEDEDILALVKLHVTAALKEAAENAETTWDSANNVVPNRDLILKAYPLDNIK